MAASDLRNSDYGVLLFGAGASHGHKLPVMKHFMDVAKEKFFAYKKEPNKSIETLLRHYEAMLTFHQQCNESASRIKMDWDNIEELYTQADLRRLSHIPDKDEAENLCRSIAWAIWDVYRSPRPIDGQPVELEAFCRMIDKIREAQLTPAIITTNYDVCVERAFQRRTKATKIPFAYPGFQTDAKKPELMFPTDQSVNLDSSRTKIVKLHGSVSWFFGDGDEYIATSTIGDSSVWDVAHAGLSYDHFVAQLRGEMKGSGAGLRPAIIPPMLGKGSASSLFAMQWQTAISILARARYIVVIGYSFPTTDAFMKRLLSDALKDNHNLKQFCIVDLQTEAEWSDRLTTLFNPTFRDNRVVFGRGQAFNFFDSVGQHSIDSWPGIIRSMR